MKASVFVNVYKFWFFFFSFEYLDIEDIFLSIHVKLLIMINRLISVTFVRLVCLIGLMSHLVFFIPTIAYYLLICSCQTSLLVKRV